MSPIYLPINPPSVMSQPSISKPTYINSSISFSEPIKLFDSLDHNYTPGKYLQQFDARVPFSMCLQLMSDHE